MCVNIKSIKIDRKVVGTNSKSYIIAEIGSNFDGSLIKAKKLIKLAKECGADAAKFQSFVTEEILSRKGFERKSSFQRKWKKSVWDVYKEAELPESWLKELFHYSRKVGIDFLSTPYYYEVVDLLVKLHVPAIKIGSGEITNLEFLKYVAKTKKPILLATGASTLKEITDAVHTIKTTGNKKIILMQSITQYPSPIEEANIRTVSTLRRRFKLNVGYSDHSNGDLVVLGSIALGCCVVEKHFTINTKNEGPDHPHSLNPLAFRTMVDKIRLLEKAMGDGIKKIEKSEKNTRVLQRRGIWAIMKIKKGETFTHRNVKVLRPVIGMSASEYKFLIGKKAKKDFDIYEPIIKKHVTTF